MPRSPCYWTRKLELDLVEFIRQRDFIWKPIGNTNHHIQQKYKAYAEFAAKLGRGFTARSVRDRWVNIRSTFNHNLRRVDKSKEIARSPADIYVPCWPLWKPLQFLRCVAKKEDEFEGFNSLPSDFNELNSVQVKEETSDMDDLSLSRNGRQTENISSDVDELNLLSIRQRGQRTDRPRRKAKLITKAKNNKCKRILDDLLKAMKPLVNSETSESSQSYWFFGKHVSERLNGMREVDAECASRDILRILADFDADNVNIDIDGVTPNLSNVT